MKPCPFCGSKDVELNHTKPGAPSRPKIFWVNCNDCNATGPERKEMIEAERLWNKRYDKE